MTDMYKTLYHLFWNSGDEWFEDGALAEEEYEALGDTDKRLYVERYATEEDYLDGQPTDEDCLLTNGNYPW